MRYSTLNEIPSTRSGIDIFAGYNHNIRIGEGEFYDMKNLTSDNFPILSPRKKRGIYQYPSTGDHSPNGLIAKDALCYVDGTKLYINNYEITGFDLTDTPKQLVSMGAYIIIFPDKKYINTLDYSDKGNIEATYTSVSTVSYEMCNIDGAPYTNVTYGTLPPENPNNMDTWIDTSTTPNTLKQYSASSSIWTPIATTYVKIKSAGIASSFKLYDGVKITGISTSIKALKDLEGQISVLWDVYRDEAGNGADDYIVVIGMLPVASTQDTALKLERKMPNLDFVIESQNRLWGCRYGTDVNGNIVNEIYASKQGDFKNWNCFMGLSTDSYTASCGTDGQWTGAITYLGHPLFFKENCLHMVYGDFPANYRIQDTACRGVQKGCGNSLAIVNETLFYKSRTGVCAYDGSLPVDISSCFGNVRYTAVDDTEGNDFLRNGAVAGALGNKYYISMKSEIDNMWYFMVYDASRNLWHKEDNTRADAFCACDGDLYYIDHSDNNIKTVLGTGTEESENIEWSAETGILGMSVIDKKYISRMLVRMSLDIGSRVIFYAQYDSTGEWHHLCTLTGTTVRSFAIPLKPHRCDHFRLRIVGTGQARIFSIIKTIEQGSDI